MKPHLRQHALVLASVGEQLADSADDRSSATDLPDALACVERTLDALSRTCEGAARALVPAADQLEPWSHRFARAARDWPGTPDGVGPSYERQAELLRSLHEAAALLRAAGRECAQARTIIGRTMEPSQATRFHAASAAAA